MIQRVQSLWLLAASICGFATLKMPYYFGNLLNKPAGEAFTATSNILLLILTVSAAVIALVSIFLYSNRPLQIKLSLAAMLASILNIVLYFVFTKKFTNGTIAISALFAYAVPVFLLLAILSIRKDEKLVKSVDRLR
jgi:drug/metabolite transporter (DMT)-like permease